MREEKRRKDVTLNPIFGYVCQKKSSQNEQAPMVQKNRGGLTGGHKTRPPPRHIFMSGLAAGTTVATLDGDLPVEFLHAGDRIVTLDRGMVRLRAITARPVQRNDLVRVAPRALAPPTAQVPDFWIAAEQPMLLRDWRARAMFGRIRVLVPAARLLDGEHLRRETGGGGRPCSSSCISTKNT